MGAYELNPLMAHLSVTFGRFRGVLIRKADLIINIFYAVIPVELGLSAERASQK